jgi:solute carrier family 25 carnitine/acylcarnitine transporter 20/29
MTVEEESTQQEAMKVLLCGGIAGIATWASVFPLDVIKTRIQAQTPWEASPSMGPQERESLLRPVQAHGRVLGAFEIAREAYRSEGLRIFYRGLGICSIRAFIVNAVQVSFELNL